MWRGGRAADGARYLIPLLLVWGIPLTVFLAVNPGGIESAVLYPDDTEQREVVVGRRNEDGRQAASFELTWTGSRVVSWPHSESVVTGVLLPRGRALVDGDHLFALDGVTVVAQSTGVPLWRDIEPGMSGPDVEWLDGLLLDAGLAGATTLDDSGRATAETGRAVRAWQQAVGVPAPDDVFTRRFTVFVGADAVVGEIAAKLGDTVSAGLELFSTAPVLVGLDATLIGPVERHRLVRGVPVVVSIDGAEVELESLSVSDSSLGLIAERVPAGIELVESVQVWRAEPIVIGVVPSSSLLLSDDGADRCVAVIRPTGSREVVRAGQNEIVAAEAGVAYVDEQLIDERVVVNPTEDDSTACV